MERYLTFLWTLLLVTCLLWTSSGCMPQSTEQSLCVQKFEKERVEKTVEQKSLLLNKITSCLEPKKENNTQVDDSSSSEESTQSQSPLFLDSLLHHIQERRSEDQKMPDQSRYLELTIRDGSPNVVKIDLTPGMHLAQTKGWSNIVNLLADALTFVLQESERMGLHPKFQYSVLFDEPGPVRNCKICECT